MNTSRRALARLFTAFLSLPLRFKITIPYLIVAVLLAGVATWVVTQSFARGLQERFNARLVDGFATASDSVFQAETAQLTAVRAIARTSGVAAAVAARDADALDALIRPIAVNSHLALVHVVGASGELIYGLRAASDGYVAAETAEFAAWDPARRVLAGESDNLGDKFAGVVEAPWGIAMYTAGPVKDGEQIAGAVLVGAPLTDLLPQMTGDSLASATVFRPDGRAALTTFGGEPALPDLTPATLAALNAEGTRRLQNRLLDIGSREYNEAVGPLLLRGQPSGWAVGVALPRSLLAQNAQFSPAQIAAGFAVAVLAVIGLGVVVAQMIAVPVFDLVRASSRVAEGDLSVAVHERARDELGLLSSHFNRMVSQLRQRELMRDLFGRVVSEEVREALLKGEVTLGGELKVVTVLFTDIRQFTTLSESRSPQEVVAVLNSYFGVVTAAVREAGGMVNKFGGDSTLAIFGAPVSAPPAESARMALRAALAIRTRMAEFNARRVQHGQEPINVGVGINTGEVITGNIGSEERFEYTVIGDTVNIAARVQGLTSQFPDSNILITDSTLAALGDEQIVVVDHGEIALKGKTRPVRVFGVIGTRLTSAQPVLRVGEVPRRDVLEALYLFCRGFDLETISLAKQTAPDTVLWWLKSAAEHFDAASAELRLEFGLSEAELQRLNMKERAREEDEAAGALFASAPPTPECRVEAVEAGAPA
jgi:adenylate cyclase